MKNSVLAVSGTLWAFSLLIGQSCSLRQINTDDLDDGATSAERGNRLGLSRDKSDPVMERFARGVDDQDKYPSSSPKFNHLILIVPCVMGVAIIVIIVVVCYRLRKYGRNSCISDEWLIWCGLMKREHPSPTPGAAYHSRVRDNAPSTASSRYNDDKESASPFLQQSEESPNRLDTPTTDVMSLTTDEEEMSPQTEALVHHCEREPRYPMFRYPNLTLETDRSNTIGQTGGIHKAYERDLENIPEKKIDNDVSVDGGDGGIRCSNGERGSDDDDDVFKGKLNYSDNGSKDEGTSTGSRNLGRERKRAHVSRDSNTGQHHMDEIESEREPLTGERGHIDNAVNEFPLNDHEDHSNPGGHSVSPSSAPPKYNRIGRNGCSVHVTVQGDVHFDFQSHVENVQIGNREINNNHQHHFHQVVPSSYPFNRDCRERQTC